MSAPIIQFFASDNNGIAGHNFMTTSEGHNLEEEIPHSYPVTIRFSPNFSPSVEHPGPDSSASTKRPVRRLAPRKGSSRRATHIPRPRNAFMIFRSEYYRTKITTNVERDHRRISCIIGLVWKDMSEDAKAPYRLMSDKEKLEHQQKYPHYRYTPGIRTSKPVKRNVKRNGQIDDARSQRIAKLLTAGFQGPDLESAVNDFDLESSGSSSPPADESSRSSSSSPSAIPSPALHDVHGSQPTTCETEAEPSTCLFRSPLPTPLPAPTVIQPLPVTRRSHNAPTMDYLGRDPPSDISPDYLRRTQVSPFLAPSSSSPDFQTQPSDRAFACDFYAPNPDPVFHGGAHYTPQHYPNDTSQTLSHQNSLQQPYGITGSESYGSDGFYSEYVPRDRTCVDMSASQYYTNSSLYMNAQGDLQSGSPDVQFNPTVTFTMYTNPSQYQSDQVTDPSNLNQFPWFPRELLADL